MFSSRRFLKFFLFCWIKVCNSVASFNFNFLHDRIYLAFWLIIGSCIVFVCIVLFNNYILMCDFILDVEEFLDWYDEGFLYLYDEEIDNFRHFCSEIVWIWFILDYWEDSKCFVFLLSTWEIFNLLHGLFSRLIYFGNRCANRWSLIVITLVKGFNFENIFYGIGSDVSCVFVGFFFVFFCDLGDFVVYSAMSLWTTKNTYYKSISLILFSKRAQSL